MMIVAIIVGAIALIHLASFVINRILSRDELDNIQPTGTLVEIGGKYKHVFSMGTGQQTIVLLPGLGVALPSVDFRPLMTALADKYTVVCVEYFGYGFSEDTKMPRTNINYVLETRQALAEAGFSPPYILMPYSASGIYSEYYATEYPEEVAALILLDTPSTAEKELPMPRIVCTLSKVQQAIGLARFLNPLLLPKLIGLSVENGYTKQEISHFLKFSNHALTDAVMDQMLRYSEAISEVMGIEFPSTVPVLAIKADKSQRGTGKKSIDGHLKKLGEHAQYHVIAGSNHSTIYHDRNYRREICEEADRFLEANKQENSQ